MSEILQSRYDQLVRRVGDLKGPGSKVDDVISELLPIIDVENMPAELLLLMGTRLAIGEADLSPGGVGTFGQAMLRNPPNSGAIITILEIRTGTDQQQEMVAGPTLTTYPDAQPSAFVDTRIFPEPTVGQVLSDNTLLVPGSTFYRFRLLSGREVVWKRSKGIAVIAPATAFSVSVTNDATNFNCSFLWTERVAQPSELNL